MHRILITLTVLVPIIAGVLSACFVFDEPEPLTPEEQARADTDRALVERWKYAKFAATYEIEGLPVPATARLSNDGVYTEFSIRLTNSDGSTTELTMDHDGKRDRACLRRFASGSAVAPYHVACDIRNEPTTNGALFKQSRFVRGMFAAIDPSFVDPTAGSGTCYSIYWGRKLENPWHECYAPGDIMTYADGLSAVAYVASLRERFITGSYSVVGVLDDWGVDRENEQPDVVAGWPDEMRKLTYRCCTFRATAIEPR